MGDRLIGPINPIRAQPVRPSHHLARVQEHGPRPVPERSHWLCRRRRSWLISWSKLP